MIVGIIPARYASSRLMGKPLAIIQGKTMIQRVWEQAKKCQELIEVIVATDHQAIFDEVLRFGGIPILTDPDLPNGTLRCYEALTKLDISPDAIINIQGDEPFVHPNQIAQLASLLTINKAQIATLVKKIENENQLVNPSVVKAVVNINFEALYFSRSPIPFSRDISIKDALEKYPFYHHVGLYGYSISALKEIVSLKEGILEKIESLEQLRWLENGFKISTALTNYLTIAVDTAEDLENARIHALEFDLVV